MVQIAEVLRDDGQPEKLRQLAGLVLKRALDAEVRGGRSRASRLFSSSRRCSLPAEPGAVGRQGGEVESRVGGDEGCRQRARACAPRPAAR